VQRLLVVALVTQEWHNFLKETKCFPLVGYLLGYTLASYMGYPTEANITGFGCSNISTIGTGGQGVLYPGTWVAV